MKRSTSHRKAKRKSPLSDRKATVFLERNGATIRVEDVDAKEAGVVLVELLNCYRAIAAKYPELTQDLNPVGGYDGATQTDEGEYEQGRKRMGFAR